MARPLRIEYPGAVYHVTSRGNERREVFREADDRVLFLSILGRTVERWRWIVHAYCLMGNHYHLVIETPEPTLSRGMRQLNGEYTQAFNRLHLRVGHLFQGRFKAIHIEKESHLLEVCRYVVLNPVRVRGAIKVSDPGDWPWSNYLATIGKKDPPSWLQVSWTLAHFGTEVAKARREYRRFVSHGMSGKSSLGERSGKWIGSEGFGERLQKIAAGRGDPIENPRSERLPGRQNLPSYFPPGIRKDRLARNEGIYRAYLEGRYSQREIAEYLGLHYVTISCIVRSMENGLNQLPLEKKH